MEFLQHPATLYCEEVVAWINPCVGVVAFVEASTYGTPHSYIKDKWFDMHYSLPQVLTDIQVDSQAVEHYNNVLLSGTEYTYERQRYERTVSEVENHILRDLLVDVALQRYQKANRYTVSLTILEKVMLGEYGWLPAGSPLHLPDLPIVTIVDDVSYMARRGDTEPLQENFVAIKNLPRHLQKWQLLEFMAKQGLPMPIRLTCLHKDEWFIGVAFADYHDSEIAAEAMTSMNQLTIDGREVMAEPKTMQSRMHRNLVYRHERHHRVWSGETSSTERETESLKASTSTADADASSQITDQNSVVADMEAGAESIASGSDEYHSCSEWPSAEQ
ncbi:hypothetical protein CLAFUW4_09826 [Fulvia fulva]|uniref:RRM domain-containing protein n=1 Tax=Passalora fulva TaxID=5499 RepID=A0A9Q8PH44_PASFU|nr:uncharacterized protein CLAFUR5_12414 [Fulvia fulva]KAK4615656.1 hypothetical protein CLAFUR4_09832 [Fulvia fulva]KAK4616602.1 hypothetical protein CLAFUR0_09825 [Fulvia fulva]UJO22544.1 hypothetical protein CLAFUR5_12414 [Fulvia fulva]WPV19305.1 hypothetical protein CLAFUW4_09826 [Fulvia fulva]WPV34380.1 hypothetical protein CLAFUW7_09829 [Fulvia fulva]